MEERTQTVVITYLGRQRVPRWYEEPKSNSLALPWECPADDHCTLRDLYMTDMQPVVRVLIIYKLHLVQEFDDRARSATTTTQTTMCISGACRECRGCRACRTYLSSCSTFFPSAFLCVLYLEHNKFSHAEHSEPEHK
jgi:hypothetical protein